MDETKRKQYTTERIGALKIGECRHIQARKSKSTQITTQQVMELLHDKGDKIKTKMRHMRRTEA